MCMNAISEKPEAKGPEICTLFAELLLGDTARICIRHLADYVFDQGDEDDDEGKQINFNEVLAAVSNAGEVAIGWSRSAEELEKKELDTGYMLGNVIPMANWEKYGDYVIGASLILVAAYFFLQESQHLVADADGNIVVAGCGCAQPHPATGTHAHHHGCSDSHHAEDDCTEETPLIIQVEDVHDVKGRDTKGAIVGFVQGMCCPMGLVQLCLGIL
ncbi:unnamed protein product [Symbiodinium microadriaticum]|nr:unnamed protein product [Symbiodinium microadriaticum]